MSDRATTTDRQAQDAESARIDASFVDAHGVEIHYSVWPALGPARAVVQLEHGVGEYALRYSRLARRLAASGYTVYADDHRGHGRTGVGQYDGDLSKLGRLGPGGLRATIAAIEKFTALIREAHPGLPLVLLGHSWGSLMAQDIIDRNSERYDAVVLTGTAYRTPLRMNSGDLAKRHRVPGGTGHEWLSRDPAVWEDFAADPFTFDARVLALFGVVDALRLLGRPKHLARDVPMRILIGSDDPLGGPKSVELLAAAYRRAGLTEVSVRVYEGARHEVFNETNRDEVTDELVAWLDAHTPPLG